MKPRRHIFELVSIVSVGLNILLISLLISRPSTTSVVERVSITKKAACLCDNSNTINNIDSQSPLLPINNTQIIAVDSSNSSYALIDPNLNYTHQHSARIPRPDIHQRACSHISHQALSLLTSSNFNAGKFNPVFHHFRNGQLLYPGESLFTGDEFCTVFVIPQSSPNATNFRNLPIDGWGPDSIHAEISSSDVRIVLQSPEFWGFVRPTVVNANVSEIAFYMSAYSLNHPGQYQMYAEIEFSNWDWVMEDDIDLREIKIPHLMTNSAIESRSAQIHIQGDPVSRPTQLCFHDGSNDMQGRWYRASSFSIDGNQTMLNPAAHLSFADHNNTVDKWGWTFAPDHCSLTYLTSEDHITCLGDRTLQVLGDSNSRRVLKSIMSGGISWCQDHEERMCQCEDHYETEMQDVNWNTIDATYFKDTDRRDDPIVFGNNTHVYFDFIGGIVNQKLFNSWHFFYDGSQTYDSLIDRRQKSHGAIDVVHVSVIGWDMAAVKTPNEWIASFEHFRKHLHSSYAPGTRFIHRLANSLCCGNQNRGARYSEPRFAMWNALYRQWWQQDEDEGIHRVIDVTAIQGRRDAEQQFYCPTTHMRSSHVRIEQMMWMNAVCQKGDNGRVVMRHDFGLKERLKPPYSDA